MRKSRFFPIVLLIILFNSCYSQIENSKWIGYNSFTQKGEEEVIMHNIDFRLLEFESKSKFKMTSDYEYTNSYKLNGDKLVLEVDTFKLYGSIKSNDITFVLSDSTTNENVYLLFKKVNASSRNKIFTNKNLPDTIIFEFEGANRLILTEDSSSFPVIQNYGNYTCFLNGEQNTYVKKDIGKGFVLLSLYNPGNMISTILLVWEEKKRLKSMIYKNDYSTHVIGPKEIALE